MKTNAADDSIVVPDDVISLGNQDGRVGSPDNLIAASERLSQWVYSLEPHFLMEGYAKPGSSRISCRLYEDTGYSFGLPMMEADGFSRTVAH